jgi:predicted nuclease of predicted toxin-antitoxin system
VRVKVDENLPVAVADVFREGGHDPETVIDERLGGRDDLAVIDAARREDRALVTLDTGFRDIRTYPPNQFAGIIVLRPQTQAIPDLIAVVRRLLLFAANADVTGRLWIVEPLRIRVRG